LLIGEQLVGIQSHGNMSGRDLVCTQQTTTPESSFQTRLSYIFLEFTERA